MSETQVRKTIEVYLNGTEFPAIVADLTAVEFRAPWVSVAITDADGEQSVNHFPNAAVRMIRIFDKKENHNG